MALRSNLDVVSEITGGSGINPTPLNKIQLTLVHGENETTLTQVKNLAIESRFLDKVSDIYTITCLFPLGDYVHDILPYKEVLYLNMVVEYVDPEDEKQEKVINFSKLLSVYLDQSFTNSMNSVNLRASRDILNKENPIMLSFKAYDIPVVAMKKVNSTMGLKEVTAEEALTANFTYYVEKAKVLIDKKPLELTVDIRPLDNTETLNHVFVDQGPHTEVDLTTFPFYLQEVYGAYNTGLISYFVEYSDGKKVYIRPRFDIRDYKRAENKLDIYVSSPGIETMGFDKTYMLKEGILNIITKDMDKMFMDGNLEASQKGTALAYYDPVLLKRSSKVTIDGDKVLNENPSFKVQSMNKLDIPNGKIKFIGASDNPYRDRSEIVMNEARVGGVKWDNSCHFLIEPSMPFTLHVEVEVPKEEDKTELKVFKFLGNIMGINTIYNFMGDGRVRGDSELTIVVRDSEELKEVMESKE